VLNEVPLDALVVKLATNRNAIYQMLFVARRKLRAALAADGYRCDLGFPSQRGHITLEEDGAAETHRNFGRDFGRARRGWSGGTGKPVAQVAWDLRDQRRDAGKLSEYPPLGEDDGAMER
jgi:hypothetical protein